jgi:hypothetical protein
MRWARVDVIMRQLWRTDIGKASPPIGTMLTVDNSDRKYQNVVTDSTGEYSHGKVPNAVVISTD